MQAPRAILFDVDDTLAESFRPPVPEMIDGLLKLLALRPLAILSAAGFQRIEHDFLPRIANSKDAGRFYVLSDGTSRCNVYRDHRWQELYRVAFTTDERGKIVSSMKNIVAETGVELNPAYEPLIVDQEGKVAYALLGLQASEKDKASWDPDRTKREKLREALQKHIPEFEVVIGGKTTLDVFPKDINKAYGVRWLSKELGIPPQDMLYIADAFYPGGNDAVTIPTGIQTRPVSGPSDTLRIINELLKICS